MNVKYTDKKGEIRTYNYDHRKYYNYDPEENKNKYSFKRMTPEEGIQYYTDLYPGENIQYDSENKIFVSDSGRYFSMFKTYGEINGGRFGNKLLTPEEGIKYYSSLYPGEEIRYNEEFKVFVSDQGNIFSRSKKVGKFPHNNNLHGYSQFRNNTVHKIVMKTFDKYVEGMEIDHINNIRDDNRLCNLQMISHADNVKKRERSNDKKVYCIELDKTYKSLTEAAREMNLSKECLCIHLKGGSKSYAGYHWRYAQ